MAFGLLKFCKKNTVPCIFALGIVIAALVYFLSRERYVDFAKAETDLVARQDIYHGEKRNTVADKDFEASREFRENVAYVDNTIEDNIEKAQL